MKKVYYLFISTLLFIFPIISNAATIEFGDIVKNDNTVKYDIIYKLEENETPEDSITLSINTVNDNLNYELFNKISGAQCNLSNCIIVTTTVTATTPVATITVTNNTENEIKDAKISINNTTQEKIFSISAKTVVTEKPKSNNSNMTAIKLSVGTLDKTFDQNVTDYTITGIKDTVNSITLTPTCDNCDYTVTCPTGGCSVSNKKRVSLETGANNVAINIISEDKLSNKTYMFNIYRGDIITSSPYLEDLKITGLVLSPKFDSLNNDYSVTLKDDLDKLDIVATPEDPTADVKIKGNEKLKIGENTITITVTSSDGENKQVYTILVTKEEEETTTKKIVVTKINKKKDNKWIVIGIFILAVLIIIISFLIIFKKKKKKNKKKDADENRFNTTEELKKENTDSLNILEDTRREMDNEKKSNVDDALDDLMKTKKLELGDLDLFN